MKNADKPIYPCDIVGLEKFRGSQKTSFLGLTKREYLAFKIMANLKSSGILSNQEMARMALRRADALLEMIEKTTNP